MKFANRVLAVIVVVGLLAAACGATPTPTPTKVAAPPTPTTPAGTAVDKVEIKQPVEIVFWHTSTQTQEKTLLSFIDQFNASQPNIKVKPEFGGRYADIRKKILAAITAKTTPDIAIAYQNTVAEYAAAGVIQPLDDYVNSVKYGFTKDDLADFFPSFLAASRYPGYNNQLMSFPFLASIEVMYYNIDLLKQAGFDGNPPKTWDDFTKMCKAALKINSKGYAISVSASNLSSWIFTRGGDVVSADGKKATFNEKPGVDALTWLKDLVDSGCAYQIAEAYGDQTDFAAGKVMFTFGSTAGLPYYADAIKDKNTGQQRFNWSIQYMPYSTPNPVVDLYGPNVTVFKSTPEKQLAAWLFIKWFTAKEQTARWGVETGYFPVRKAAAESDIVKAQFVKDPRYQKAFEYLPYGKGEPRLAAWEPIRGYMQDAITAVITGKLSPKDALDQAAQKANEALASQ